MPAEQVHFVGNTMIDTLERLAETARRRAHPRATRSRDRAGYALVTLHRPSNVDDPAQLAGGGPSALRRRRARLPVVFPVHARTRAGCTTRGRLDALGNVDGLRLAEPLGYLDFVRLMAAPGWC